MATEEHTSSPPPTKSSPKWADIPWRASLTVVGITTVVSLAIGPIDTDRQLGAAIGRGVGPLLWAALFLGWHPKTRRWLPTVTLVLAVLVCLAALLPRH